MVRTPNKLKISFKGDMSAELLTEHSREFADWVVDFFERLDRLPVLPDVEPGQIRARLPDGPPEFGEDMSQILKDLDDIIVPGMTHWNHPSFFAYFPSSGSLPGILAELVSAVLNNNGMLWKSCPSSTELEQTTLDWLRQLIGLPSEFWGTIYDTASTSNMHAIAAAREQLGHLQIRELGLAGRNLPQLRMYISEHTHSSVAKGAIALGLGLRGVRKIRVDDQFRMDAEALREAIRSDRQSGHLPFCVVATIGTTSTTSVDPVEAIADICREEELWLHIDAAYAGSAAILPEMRHFFAGCDRADSFVMNPHKWLFVPIDLSVFYTRKPDVLKRAFSLETEYLRTPEDANVENYMDYGIPLGRRFRSLKLWFVLRYFGTEGLADRIRYHLHLAQKLSSWVDEHAEFERMAPTHFGLVCLRAHPRRALDTEGLNRLNERLLESVNATREIFLSHSKVNGQFIIRFAIGHIRTEESHVRRGWDLLVEHFERLTE